MEMKNKFTIMSITTLRRSYSSTLVTICLPNHSIPDKLLILALYWDLEHSRLEASLMMMIKILMAS